MKYPVIAILLLFFSINSFSESLSGKYRIDEAAIENIFALSEEIPADIQQAAWNLMASKGDDKQVIAGVLGILCGSFGIHRFYLGHMNAGLIYLGVTLCGGIGGVILYTAGTVGTAGIGGACLWPLLLIPNIPWVIGVIDGILYLVAEKDEFRSKYADNPKIIQWLN